MVQAPLTSTTLLLPHGKGFLYQAFQGTIINLVQWLRLAVETMSAVVTAAGGQYGDLRFARAFALRRPERYGDVRQTLARYLALALELQLGADILSTAIAPSWAAEPCKRSLKTNPAKFAKV